MKISKLLLAVLILNLLYLGVVMWFASYGGPITPFSWKVGGVRWFADGFDRGSYLWRGAWIRSGKIPYRELYSDYPFLMTMYYAYPAALSPSAPVQLNLFSMGNFVWLAVLLQVSVRLSRAPHRFIYLWYALPVTAYFVYNRFDIIPATLTVVAVSFMVTGRHRWSALALALAINAKWYPVAFVVPLALYLRQRSGWRAVAGMLLVIIVVTAVLHGAGWLIAGSASLDPYRFHVERRVEPSSLYGAVRFILTDLAGVTLPGWALALAAKFWLVPMVLFPFTIKRYTDRKLIAVMALAAILMIASAKIFSPQWMVWFTTLAVLIVKEKRGVVLMLAVLGATYLKFPVLYDLYGETSMPYKLGALLCLVTIVMLAVELYRMCRARDAAP